jgi:DNA-binding transcriptional LysR family regulator
MRSSRTGRVRHRTMREAATLGLGVVLLSVSDVLSSVERRELVRLLPHWYVDAGAISIYYATRALLPAKTRAFVDFVVEAFERERSAARFAGSIA